MRERTCRVTLILVVLIIISACDQEVKLDPFVSDGCTLFPDSSIISNKDWCVCCFQHDLAYWKGGTKYQREVADWDLKQCVLEKTGNEHLAKLMFEGVRLGGSPYFYNWYRWGYGWSYERKYKSLTNTEEKHVKKLEAQFFDSNKDNFCD